VIATGRLVLRPWRETDRPAYVAQATDPVMGEWLGGALSRAAAGPAFEAALVKNGAAGSWNWAVARLDDQAVIGALTLGRVMLAEHPLAGSLEIGWRLLPGVWGRGYAREAAAAVLGFGFAHIEAPEIVAFTAASNARSEAVMRAIGMVRDPARDFEHPALARGHPLRPHIVYAAARRKA
jgi:RimJ/RimL family protein N-acetyltransferase